MSAASSWPERDRISAGGQPRLRLVRPEGEGPQNDGVKRAAERAKLWGAYWSDGARPNRDALLEAYADVVVEAAEPLAPELRSPATTPELASFGRLGLMDAVERFAVGADPESFVSFASSYVRTALLDALRELRRTGRS